MRIGKLLGHRMNTLDLGGGFPSAEIPQAMLEALELTNNENQGY